MKSFKFLILILFFISLKAQAFYTEIGASYGFERIVYGETYENKINGNTVLASLAFYLFSLTAVEFNYSWLDTDILDKSIYPTGNNPNLFVTGQRTQISAQTFGIGIRQAFTSTTAFIRPMISLGYARRITSNSGYFDTFDATDESAQRTDKVVENSSKDLVFLAIHLKIRIIEGLFISGSLRSLFGPKEVKEAHNNLKALVGFSWLF